MSGWGQGRAQPMPPDRAGPFATRSQAKLQDRANLHPDALGATGAEVHIGRPYTYVTVAIDPLRGRLWRAWQANMKGEVRARTGGPGPRSRVLTTGTGSGKP